MLLEMPLGHRILKDCCVSEASLTHGQDLLRLDGVLERSESLIGIVGFLIDHGGGVIKGDESTWALFSFTLSGALHKLRHPVILTLAAVWELIKTEIAVLAVVSICDTPVAILHVMVEDGLFKVGFFSIVDGFMRMIEEIGTEVIGHRYLKATLQGLG